jgi:membrane-associated HD superfamily phosphohydrolase
MKLNLTQTLNRFINKTVSLCLTFALAFQVTFYSTSKVAIAGTSNSSTIVATNDASLPDSDETGDERKGVVGNVQDSVDRVKAAADRNEDRNRGKAREAIERAQDDVQDKVRAAEDNTKYEMRKVSDKAVIQTDGDRNIDGARTERKQTQDKVREQARAAADDKYQLRKNADKASGEANQLKVKTDGTQDNPFDAVKGFFGK